MLTQVPDNIYSGSTVSLDLSFDDYAASDGWTLKLYFAGKSVGSVAAIANGSRFTVELSRSFTASLEPGNYAWRAIVTNGTQDAVAGAGVTRMLANIAEATAGAMQTFEERMLAVIEAVLEGRITADMESYQIAGRAVTKIPVRELVELREVYRLRVEGQRNPGKMRPQMRVTFTGTGAE